MKNMTIKEIRNHVRDIFDNERKTGDEIFEMDIIDETNHSIIIRKCGRMTRAIEEFMYEIEYFEDITTGRK